MKLGNNFKRDSGKALYMNFSDPLEMIILETSKSLVRNKTDGKGISELPGFATYTPPFEEIEAIAKPFQKYKNVIVIGNGGSITSFKGYYQALFGKHSNDKQAFFVDTGEPDELNRIAQAATPQDSVVIPITKSGTNTQMTESTLFFLNKRYPMLGVTSKQSGAMREIFEKMQIPYLDHPSIGGRYSGFTPTGLLPAHLCGINIKEMFKGAEAMYKKCAPNSPLQENPALTISTICAELDQKGYDQIFMPVYSKKLEGFITLFMQLLHESSGKNGKGQTLIGVGAPESQHHTNQRFFGGPQNMIGLFVRVEEQDDYTTEITVDDKLKNIPYRNGTLGALDGISYADSHSFEYLGTSTDATNNKIPHMTLTVKKVDPYSVGEFVALWHYIAVYSSVLRGADPFDQPQVETAKDIAFAARNAKKGI